MESGLLLIDKAEGPTSSRVVQRVKAILGAKKVGHLGSLDPFASGLLLLGVNEGTKIAQLFLTAPKSYTGTLALGVETDTQDRTGRVLRVADVPPLDDGDLERLSHAFTGVLWQLPPMFSALKKGGVPLYRLARQGKIIERAKRQVKIDHLRLWKLGKDEIGFEVSCSKGTYIRTLAADMGHDLGCGGHLKSLRRISCGALKIDQAITLEDLKTLWDQGKAPMVPLVEALGDIPRFSLSPSGVARLRAGRQDVLAELGNREAEWGVAGLLDGSGNLVALAGWTDADRGGKWQLLRVFAPPSGF